jgi:hypothetical protein
VVFAIVLGVLIDHVLRWWHKRLARNDVQPAGPLAAGLVPAAGPDAVLAGPSTDAEAGRK